MSFSRLSPRSARTGIARGRAARQHPEDSSRHLRLWDAIRRTREELDSWQRQVDQVDALFQQYIVPREEQLTDEYCNVTALLMAHFEQSALSTADQSLAGLWITENLQSLSDHPFASIQRRQTLNDTWRVILSVDGPVENQLARLARSKFSPTSSHDELIRKADTTSRPDNYQDRGQLDTDKQSAGNQHTQAGQHRNSQPNENCSGNTGKQPHDPSGYADSGADDIDEKINILEQQLSVERLFRQLAKVLHPDRELNESLKAEKHILMSQCLKARQAKDITTLLDLYCKHVGDLPDDLTDNSHEELVRALQLQLKQLQSELRQLRFGDPLHTSIVERYSSSTDLDCQHRIKVHAESLDIEIENMKLLVVQLDTQTGLLDALEQRRKVEMDRLAINELTGMSS